MATKTNAAIIADALAWMRANVGRTEDPKGSNRVWVWDLVRPDFQGESWCAGTTTAALLAGGADMRPLFPSGNSFYCPWIEETARRMGWWKTSGNNAGDLVLYGTGSVASHIGMSSPIPGPLFGAYEGNTSAGNSGSQNNGDGLYFRERPRTFIRGWVDTGKMLDYLRAQGMLPEVKESSTLLVEDGDWGPASARAFGSFLRTAPIYPPKTPKEIVRQPYAAAVQRWAPVTPVDSEWGPATTRALQRHLGVTADGEWGPNTARALQRYLNAGIRAGTFRVAS